MPGLDNGLGNVAAAVPYSWEAAPGKPIEDLVTDSTEPLRAPLPPPPGSRGVRKPATFIEPTFGGFEPEADVAKSAGPHFGEKLFKKLHAKLRRKSKALAAAFSNEITRALTDHKKRMNDSEASVQSSLSYDSDEHLRGWSTASGTFDLPDTPLSSGSLSSMSSLSSTSWESTHQDRSQRNIDVLLAASSSSDDEVNYEECLSGPRESAWHEDAEEEEELTEQEWHIVRYASLQRHGSSLISTLVRQSSLTPLGDHSYQFSPIRACKAERE